LARGDTAAARFHLKRCLAGADFEGLDRAAFLLARLARDRGDRVALVAVQQRLSGWKPTPFTRWAACEALLGGVPPDRSVGEASPGVIGAEILAARVFLDAGAFSAAMDALAAVRPGTPAEAPAWFLRAEALEASGADPTPAWKSLAALTPRRPLERELVGMARLRQAAAAVEAGADPAPLLERVPARCTASVAAAHLSALLAQGENARRDAAKALREALRRFPEAPESREARSFLAGEALEEGYPLEARRIYAALDAARAAAEDTLIALKNNTNRYWMRIEANGFVEAPILDYGNVSEAARLAADDALDLDRTPADGSLTAVPGAVVPTGRKLPEPTDSDIATLDRLETARAAAVHAREAAVFDARREIARLRRRRDFLDHGDSRAAREQAERRVDAARLEALDREAAARLRDLAGVRDRILTRIARQSRLLLAVLDAQKNRAEALEAFHVAGPRIPAIHESPDGYPSLAALLTREEATGEALTAALVEFRDRVPGLVRRSFDERWRPAVEDRLAALFEADHRQALHVDRTRERLAMALAGAAESPRLSGLRTRARRFAALADSLDRAVIGARREIAVAALDRGLAALETEREALDYGLATAAYEAAVFGDGDEAPPPDQAVLRADAGRRYRRFLDRYPSSPVRGEVRFRLADLLLFTARKEFRSAMAAHAGGTGTFPVLDLDPSVSLYRAILAEDPSFGHLDAVRFNLGTILADRGDPEAASVLAALVEQHPESPYLQEAELRLGDLRFEGRDYRGCLEPYGRAAAGADPSLTAIALYRAAWARFTLDDYPAAADTFRRLLDLYASGEPILLKTDLREEAEAYLVRSMARAGGAAFFADTFDRIGPRDDAPRLLLALGDHLAENSLFDEAERADRLYLERYGATPGALRAAEGVVAALRAQNRPEAAEAAAAALAPRFDARSAWFADRANDSLAAAGDVFAFEAYRAAARGRHLRSRGEIGDAGRREALALYDTLLAGWPEAPEAPSFHYRAGELALQLERFPEALAHFDRAAASDTARFAVDAAWDGVAARDLRYRAGRSAAVDTVRGDERLADDLIAAAEAFIAAWPKDRRAADALWRTGHLRRRLGRPGAAAADFARLARDYPEDPRAIPATVLRGDVLFRAGSFADAALAYEKALAAASADSLRARLEARIPLAYYREAERVESAEPDHPEHAAVRFEALARRHFGYEHASQALYRAGLDYAAGNKADEAVHAWENLAARYPEHPYARDALIRAVELRTAAGDAPGAAADALVYADLFPDDPETALALLAAPARRVLDRLAEADSLGTAGFVHPGADPSAPADTSGIEAPLAVYLRLAEAHPDLADPAVPARLAYLEAEAKARVYRAISLTLPLAESLAEKKSRLDTTLEAFGRCAAYGAPEWTHAATYRIGEVLLHFGRSLEASERPADLTAEERAAYDDVLAEQSWTFYDRGERVWSDLLRQSSDSADPGGWLARSRLALWPRLAERFLFRPEVEYPLIAAEAPSAPAVLTSRAEPEAPSGGAASEARPQ